MSTDPIIAHPAPSGITSDPAIRHHCIGALCLWVGDQFYLANGVLETPGGAWLGQVRADADSGAFVVAPLLDAQGAGYLAPEGWQSSILATAPGGGEDPPPPPAAPLVFEGYLARRRALVVAPAAPAWMAVLASPAGPLTAPHCPRCAFVCAFSTTVLRCLHPRCTWERAVRAGDRRRLVADVTCGVAA